MCCTADTLTRFVDMGLVYSEISADIERLICPSVEKKNILYVNYVCILCICCVEITVITSQNHG